MSGENLPLVGKLLGHRRHQTTAGYAHLADGHPVEAAERVGSIIVAAMEKIMNSWLCIWRWIHDRPISLASAFLVLLVFSAPSVHAESWSVWKFHDEMNESISKGAASAWTTPTRALSFPHHDLRGVAGFGCENGIPSFYFRFTETPNLSGNETLASLDGAEVLRTRIKFDRDDPKYIALLRTR